MQASEDRRSPASLIEILDIALAVLSWILPDIPVWAKIIATTILVVPIALARLGLLRMPDVSVARLSVTLKVPLIKVRVVPLSVPIVEPILPIMVAIVEVVIIFAIAAVEEGELPGDLIVFFWESIQGAFVYGVIVGLPVYQMSKAEFGWMGVPSTIGCLVQIIFVPLFLLFLLLLLPVEYPLLDIELPTSIFPGILVGPFICLLPISFLGDLLDKLSFPQEVNQALWLAVFILGFWLQNFQFEIIERLVAKLRK